MDLCRRILFEVEKWDTTLDPKTMEIDAYTSDEINYNTWLLAQQGLIEALDFTGDGSSVHCYRPRCLTYQGHDFLEHARNDARWTKAKEKLMSVGGTMTIQMLQVVLKQLVVGELNSGLPGPGGSA